MCVCLTDEDELVTQRRDRGRGRDALRREPCVQGEQQLPIRSELRSSAGAGYVRSLLILFPYSLLSTLTSTNAQDTTDDDEELQR